MVEASIAEMEAHLAQSDTESCSQRVARFRVVSRVFAFAEDGIGLWGGSSSAQSFAEMRFAYMDGLFLATILLAVACLEQELAGMLHASGDDSAANAKFTDLIRKSEELNLIDAAMVEELDKLRVIRNSYTHFRTLKHPQNWAMRSIAQEADHTDVLESDALQIMEVLASFMRSRHGSN